MKIVHLSDLHIGKRLNEFSLIEDQQYILKQILTITDGEKPDAVVIAGDVYDKSIPSTDAVELFDDFLVALSKMKLQVFIISGNHDSPERLSFGNRIMDTSGIHIASVYHGKVEPTILRDSFGEVAIYMLPFVKPAMVRQFFPDEEISTYSDAVKAAVRKMKVSGSRRNVLVTHQFVTGAEKCDSEDISIGGTDNVDASVFSAFDYVALGHLHTPQNVGGKIRYCGTPLKYSFSECHCGKSVTIVTLGEKGSVGISLRPLVPLHEMREIRGKFAEISSREYSAGTTLGEDYVRITLTDEEDIPNALPELRKRYHNLMRLDYDNARTRATFRITEVEGVDEKTPLELFAEFYKLQNGMDMTDEQISIMENAIEKIWRSDK